MPEPAADAGAAAANAASRHQDRFDLYRWARQALGPKGVLLGWLPPVQDAIRREAAATLAAWQAKDPSGSSASR